MEDAEGVEVVRARVRHHLTAHQAEGLLGRLAAVPVLVEVQVTVPDGAPARLPLAVHQHVQVTCGGWGGERGFRAGGWLRAALASGPRERLLQISAPRLAMLCPRDFLAS